MGCAYFVVCGGGFIAILCVKVCLSMCSNCEK